LKFARKIFRFGTLASLLIFILLSGAFLAAWQWPQILINPSNAARLAGFLKKKGIIIEWKRLDLRADSLSFFVKQVELGSADLCVDMRDSGFHSCFHEAKLTATIDIKGWFPKYAVKQLRLGGGAVELKLSEQEKKKSPPQDADVFDTVWPTPPAFLKDVALGVAFIELRQFHLSSPGFKVDAKINLNGLGEVNKSRWIAETEGSVSIEKDRYQAHAYLNLQSEETVWFGPYVVDAAGKGELPGKKNVDLKLHGVPRGSNRLDYILDGSFRATGRRFLGHAEGTANPDGINALIRATGFNLAPHIPRAEINRCHLDYGRAYTKKAGRRLDIDCPVLISADFEKTRKGPYAEFLRRMSLLLRANLKLEDLPNRPGAIDGNIVLRMDPLLEKIREGSAALTTRVSGVLAEFPQKLSLDTELELRVLEFQKVVAMLRNFPWAIPEPFGSLSGPMKVTASAKGELMAEGGDFPIKLETRLSSEHQKLFLDGEGQLHLKLKPELHSHLDFKLALSDVVLVLPHLDMAEPPRLVPDNRIHSFAKAARALDQAEKDSSSFSYLIQVANPVDHPIRLISNLASRDIPVTLALRMANDQPIRGYVRVAAFPVELFRRTATVEHMNLGFGPDPTKTEVNGEIRVVYTDYTIRIKVLGLAQQPTIKFLSEPPLPEDQVIAVLLFGKKIDALDPNQAQSVGSTKAAVEDSAISLASMYLLASTPVESIGYDPTTQTFNAKVRLADGTSLNLGSNMRELNEVGIRKRLGPHWSITTYLQNPMDPVQRTLTAFLEWSTGY